MPEYLTRHETLQLWYGEHGHCQDAYYEVGGRESSEEDVDGSGEDGIGSWKSTLARLSNVWWLNDLTKQYHVSWPTI